jgi:hypothetical protein
MKTKFVKCSLCSSDCFSLNSPAVSVTSESRVLKEPSTLLFCQGCGHFMTSMDIDWSDYYRSVYDATLVDGGADEIVSTKDGSTVFRTDLDFALYQEKVLDRVGKDAAILEFGAGHGRIVGRSVSAGYKNVTAFDLGEKYEASLLRWLPEERVCIGRRPAGRFDVVCSFFVLEHDTDPRGSLEYLRSVCAERAVLYLVVPNYERNPGDLACADHVQHFHPERIRALVEEVGFAVTELDSESAMGATILVGHASPVRTALDASKKAELRERAWRAAAPFRSLLSRLELVQRELADVKSLYLYGAGFYATMASAMLPNASVNGVFDQNPRKHGQSRLGAKVLAPEAIAQAGFIDSTLLVCLNPEISAKVGGRFEPHFRRVQCL